MSHPFPAGAWRARLAACAFLLLICGGYALASDTSSAQPARNVDTRLPDDTGAWDTDKGAVPPPTAVSSGETVLLRSLRQDDRVLIVAPHPDDESLSSAGLMQRALAAHARIRVVFITNGDNNVWAQRFVEHRYHIGMTDRARWGARRKQEALRALARIGVPASSATFLDFHDQGTSALLMADDAAFRNAIDATIVAWHPSILVLPSPDDLHPDHNNAYVITHLELRRLRQAPPLELDYLVHTNGKPYAHSRVVLQLRPEEKQVKLEAILCHTSQMALGRARFGAFAKDIETFYPPDGPSRLSATYPVCSAKMLCATLRMSICRRNTRSLAGAKIDLALTGQGGAARLSFPLPAAAGVASVVNTITGTAFSSASVRLTDEGEEIDLPMDRLLPIRQMFVKFDRPGIAFDRAGWRELPAERQGSD